VYTNEAIVILACLGRRGRIAAVRRGNADDSFARLYLALGIDARWRRSRRPRKRACRTCTGAFEAVAPVVPARRYVGVGCEAARLGRHLGSDLRRWPTRRTAGTSCA